MEKKILYVYPDYVDELSQKKFAEIIREKKGCLYDLETFANDFNNEIISDLGMIEIIDEQEFARIKQYEVIQRLENLVHQRFNKKTLEEELSNIFNENIEIELGYEDIEDLPDWNFMFASTNKYIGGDFDVYVLMQKNKDNFNNTMYVTEVGYDFYNN